MTMVSNFDAAFARCPLVAILRGVRPDEVEAIGEELVAAGFTLLEVPMNSPDPLDSVARLAKRFEGRAIIGAGTVLDTDVALWDRLFAVNARAPFQLIQAFARRLVAAKRPGAVVNIITMSSHGGQPFLTAYSSSKGALATLTKNTAFGLREHRIRVNGLNIGWTLTPGEEVVQRTAHGAGDGWAERAGQDLPMGRLARVEDVTAIAVLLLSDASGVVTGSVIDWDQTVPGGCD